MGSEMCIRDRSLPTAKSKLPSFSAVTVTPTDLPVTSTSLLTVTLVDAVKSIVGAVISHSVSASISSLPSELELTDRALSLNINLLVELRVNPLPSVCVKVVSVSAPNPSTASSDPKVKSSPTFKSPDTSTLVLEFKSIIASPSIVSVPSADC